MKKWFIPLGAILVIGLIVLVTQKYILGRRPHDVYKVYMVSLDGKEQGSKIKGCEGDTLVAVERETVSDTHITDIYQDVAGEDEYDFDNTGLKNPLANSDLTYQSALIDANGIARVDLAGTITVADACESAQIKAQLEKPAYQFDGVKSVVVQVNGQQLDTFLKK